MLSLQVLLHLLRPLEPLLPLRPGPKVNHLRESQEAPRLLRANQVHLTLMLLSIGPESMARTSPVVLCQVPLRCKDVMEFQRQATIR
jgi:hypothetical protein